MRNVIAKGLALAGALIALPGATAVAQPSQGDPMYERRYFDDAERTQEVGIEYDGCTWSGTVPGEMQGRRGPYVQLELMSYCDEGVLRPVT